MNARLFAWLAALLLFAGAARAQDNAVDTQRFQPHATSGGFFQTEGSDVRHPVDPFSLGLWLNYAHNPLVVIEDGEVVAEIVSTQLAFQFATGLTDTVSVTGSSSRVCAVSSPHQLTG